MIGIVSLIVRLLIAGTFFVAGIAKLADGERTRKGIRDFGAPSWAAHLLGILLPLAELAVGILLLPLRTTVWGSLGAIALLIIFIAAISINLALGRTPECNCFGQLHSEPIGWPMVARNCVLAGGAGFVLWGRAGGSAVSIVGWAAGLSSGEIVGILLGAAALVAIVVEGWLIFHLLRQNGRLLLRMDVLESQVGNSNVAALLAKAPSGLAIGAPAPAFELPALSGDSIVALETLRAEQRPVLLVFSDPNCGPCSVLLPDVARWEREHATTLTLALISRGSQKANRAKIGGHQLRYVLLQKDREVAEAYKANGTPGAVLISLEGEIASPFAMGSQAIASLVAAVAGASPLAFVTSNGKHGNGSGLSTTRLELKIGQPAPPFRLPDLSGGVLDLYALRGRESLVLFWNPTCGFCTKMLPDLKRWEEHRSVGEAPQLLVVSSGTVEANVAMGLRSPVVLDQTFASGQAFRVRGTPAAVLLDAEGNIASGVASGAAAVFELANRARNGTEYHDDSNPRTINR